jgi:polyhydroxybutyrate depolymerase
MKHAPALLVLLLFLAGCSSSASAPTATAEPVLAPNFTPTTHPRDTAPAPTQSQVKPIENGGQTLVGEIESGGVTRDYLLHIPANARADQPAPLILNFHGLTSNGREQELLSGMSQAAEAYGAFVVYPDGLGEHWNVAPGRKGDADLRFICDLILTLQRQYPLDPKRIYATGISNGGGMANRLACDLSDVIAAIAPVAGAYNAWKNCNPSRPVPVLRATRAPTQVTEGLGQSIDSALPSHR